MVPSDSISIANAGREHAFWSYGLDLFGRHTLGPSRYVHGVLVRWALHLNDGGQRQPTAAGRSYTTSLLPSLSVNVHHLHRRYFRTIPSASWVTGMFIVFWAFFK